MGTLGRRERGCAWAGVYMGERASGNLCGQDDEIARLVKLAKKMTIDKLLFYIKNLAVRANCHKFVPKKVCIFLEDCFRRLLVNTLSVQVYPLTLARPTRLMGLGGRKVLFVKSI
jgi:hypothetical protein